MQRWIFSLAVISSACATSSVSRQHVAEAEATKVQSSAEHGQSAARSSQPQTAQSKSVVRSELRSVLEQGLGKFLSRVEVEPVFAHGRWAGFKIVTWKDPHLANQGIHPGDVIRTINGRSIERPEHSYEIWQQLKDAPELVVEFERNDRVQLLIFPIIDR